MTSQQLFLLNSTSYGALLIFLLLAQTPLRFITSIPQAGVALLTILFVSGYNITLFIQKVTGQSFDRPTALALSVLNSLFVLPLLTIGITLWVGQITEATAFIAYSLPVLTVPLWHVACRLFPTRIRRHHTAATESPKMSLAGLIKHPLTWAVLGVTLVHAINLSLYTFLPAPDTYSWLISFEAAIQDNAIDFSIDINRWSFSALISALHLLSGIPLFILFKYLFVTTAVLTILPLWLIARRYPSWILQLFILCLSLISPAVILEFEITRQQVIFLLFLYFAAGLLTEAAISKNKTLYYLMSFYALLGSLIHPAFVILFLLWAASFVMRYLPWLWHHKLIAGTLAIVLYPWLEQASTINIAYRIWDQGRGALRNFLSGHWNLTFPAHYISSDGYEMSWPGLVGVAKYYGFYAGPLVILLLLIGLSLLVRNKRVRQMSQWSLLSPTLPLWLTLGFFIIVAEIAPRFGNIAYLPDRAWQFVAIVCLPILILVLKATQPHYRLVATVGLILVLINVAGTTYINYLIRFTMPSYEQRAAVWIKDNLPDNRIIVSSSSKNLIRYHARTQFVGMNKIYFEAASLNDIENYIKEVLTDPTPETAKYTSSHTYPWHSPYLGEVIMHYRIATEKLQGATKVMTNTLADPTTKQPPELYLYYAKTHPKNPYANRPYASSFTGIRNQQSFPAIENHPDLFQEIYRDQNDVHIWHVNLTNLLTT